ncbi:hypothetical protein AXF42_Ash016822 [Apostasia shenzhenica]|uniref:RNA-directed DNA polymerase like n=1 Tax=Apostasia shenzhenica TaxID=1088818 RepID=A0A2I0BAK1_9ASPA|nr:hypothetical protein AXF42_Ash016822 [Apostasia shenzhenica]
MDRAVCEHHLNVSQAITPIAQKKRVMAGDRQDAIKEEINKLLGAGYIREVQYPRWLTNIVMVKKANGKWRMCVDFKSLNQACLKDTYPLPRIDTMVDRTVGYEIIKSGWPRKMRRRQLLSPITALTATTSCHLVSKMLVLPTNA